MSGTNERNERMRTASGIRFVLGEWAWNEMKAKNVVWCLLSCPRRYGTLRNIGGLLIGKLTTDRFEFYARQRLCPTQLENEDGNYSLFQLTSA
jgi:hypothetical protein